MDYSCTSKYFLTNQIEKKTTIKIIIKMITVLDFKNFQCDILSSIDDIIHLHVKIIDF